MGEFEEYELMVRYQERQQRLTWRIEVFTGVQAVGWLIGSLLAIGQHEFAIMWLMLAGTLFFVLVSYLMAFIREHRGGTIGHLFNDAVDFMFHLIGL